MRRLIPLSHLSIKLLTLSDAVVWWPVPVLVLPQSEPLCPPSVQLFLATGRISILATSPICRWYPVARLPWHLLLFISALCLQLKHVRRVNDVPGWNKEHLGGSSANPRPPFFSLIVQSQPAGGANIVRSFRIPILAAYISSFGHRIIPAVYLMIGQAYVCMDFILPCCLLRTCFTLWRYLAVADLLAALLYVFHHGMW